MRFETECIMVLQGHPRSLILAPIEKRVCNFLLSSNSNFGSISPRYTFSSEKSDPTRIPPEFWGCSPWTKLPMLWLRGAKTLINFELVKPVCSWYINGRTDGRLTIAIPRFPLRASGALNLQDLKMADQKRTKTEKVGLENDGPNRSAGKCRIWKMTDPGTSKLANNDTVTGCCSHVELSSFQNYKQWYRPTGWAKKRGHSVLQKYCSDLHDFFAEIKVV